MPQLVENVVNHSKIKKLTILKQPQKTEQLYHITTANARAKPQIIDIFEAFYVVIYPRGSYFVAM